MFPNVIIALQVIPIFTFVNIVAKAIAILLNGKIPSIAPRGPATRKYWNLFVEKAKRYGEAFTGLRRCGDVDAHLGAQARHQVEADARCALGVRPLSPVKLFSNTRGQVSRAHAATVVGNGKLDTLACQAFVQ